MNPPLFNPDIIEAMQKLGFIPVEREDGKLVWLTDEPFPSMVEYHNQRFATRKFLDDPEEPRFSPLVDMKVNFIPTLSKWFMMLEIGGVMTIKEALSRIKKQERQTTIMEDAIDMVEMARKILRA